MPMLRTLLLHTASTKLVTNHTISIRNRLHQANPNNVPSQDLLPTQMYMTPLSYWW